MKKTILAESISEVLYTLRSYQLEAVEIAMLWLKANSEPALLELSGGAGKSLIMAEIARRLFLLTGKRVLCLVPSEDLLLQNGEKMELTGEKFSYYCASVQKSLRHHIVIATEGSFKSIAEEKGHEFCCVLVDEADKVTPTFKTIIENMRKGNPLLRVLGMTGTPFRMKTGYIYELDTENRMVDNAINPFYKKLLYRITCNELIAMGYLTPVRVGMPDDHYDTEDLVIQGENFTNKSVKNAFEDKSVTERIIKDVLKKTVNAKGVLIFAATLNHAREILKYLPEDETIFLYGDMPKAERRQAIADFKAQKKKYLVNKDIATVGFDAPHADFCVLMRALESNRLFQQIVWRVVRLYDGKDYATLLDYGNNIEKLFNGSDDIFTPQIKTYGNKPSEKIEVMCEYCGTEQEFSKRQGFEQWDAFGFALDLAGDRLDPPIPSHYGRRCTGVTPLGKNQFKRCDYYWTCSECKECGHKNDIAARQCEACGLVLINPESKLSETATYIPIGERTKTRVDGMTVRHGEVINVTFDTPHGEIKCRFFPNHAQTHIARHGWAFKKATNDGQNKPVHIEYTKQKSGLCSINLYEME